MASAKEYGYFIKGSKLALIEKDTALDNDVNSRDYGPDVTNVRFKSPQSSVTDGIELEYIYSPKYRLNGTVHNVNVFPVLGWTTVGGYLSFVSASASNAAVDWTAVPYSAVTSGTAGQTGADTSDYIVVRGSSKWNGLHKIQTAGTTGLLKTYTKVKTQLPGVTETDIDFSDSEIIYNADTNNPKIYLADNFSAGDKVFVSGSETAANNGVFNISAVTKSTVIASSNLTIDTRHFFQVAGDSTTTWDESISTAATFTNETDQTDISLYKVIFEDSTKIYTDIDVLNDEADEIPISEYLSKAVVYYLKAKTAEDQGNFQLRDVMFKEFYRIVEKSDNAKIHTIRKVAPHSAAIR